MLLGKYSASINATNKFGNTALHRAVNKGHLDVVKLLTSYNICDVNAKDEDNDTPLHCAAIEGNNAMISVLIQHRAEVDERGRLGRTALHKACVKGHVACIDELLRHGADAEAKDSHSESTPLHLAATFNHPDCVKLLLDKYSDAINAAKEHLDVGKPLTSHNRCDVNAKDEDNDTPLHCAALEGNDKVISVLIQHGAEVNSEVAWEEQLFIKLAAKGT